MPYITGGFEGYVEAIYAAAEAGADAIEIGIPFSDPVMDGPTIQKANDVVLAQKISPLDIDSSPAVILKRVVLPHPEGPRRTTNF